MLGIEPKLIESIEKEIPDFKVDEHGCKLYNAEYPDLLCECGCQVFDSMITGDRYRFFIIEAGDCRK